MAIFVDKNGFNLEKTARRVMAHMGIHEDRLLFFYDSISRARSQGNAQFFNDRRVYFGESPIAQARAQEILSVSPYWKHAIYFDRKACVQSLESEIENISYHAHELWHYKQRSNHEAVWDMAQAFLSSYGRIKGPKRVLNYENSPLERDAILNEKRVVGELTDAAEYQLHLLWRADSPHGSVSDVLNRIDIAQPYNLEAELLKLTRKYWHAMPRRDDPPMTSTDESDFDQL